MSRARNQSVDNGRNTKESEEEQGRGITPYLVGGLFGVAAGLVGSYLLDKAISRVAVPDHENCAYETAGRVCCVCQDDVTANVQTPCCKKLLHRACYEKYRQHSYSFCPLCRQRWV